MASFSRFAMLVSAISSPFDGRHFPGCNYPYSPARKAFEHDHCHTPAVRLAGGHIPAVAGLLKLERRCEHFFDLLTTILVACNVVDIVLIPIEQQQPVHQLIVARCMYILNMGGKL